LYPLENEKDKGPAHVVYRKPLVAADASAAELWEQIEAVGALLDQKDKKSVEEARNTLTRVIDNLDSASEKAKQLKTIKETVTKDGLPDKIVNAPIALARQANSSILLVANIPATNANANKTVTTMSGNKRYLCGICKQEKKGHVCQGGPVNPIALQPMTVTVSVPEFTEFRGRIFNAMNEHRARPDFKNALCLIKDEVNYICHCTEYNVISKHYIKKYGENPYADATAEDRALYIYLFERKFLKLMSYWK
jgi:hypothetical protein